MNRRIGKLLVILGLAATALGLGVAPAVAAPELEVTLERDEAEFPVVRHSDERVDFTVKVKNVAPPLATAGAGDPLSCTTLVKAGGGGGGQWQNGAEIKYDFEFRWLRDGAPITGWQPPAAVIGEPEDDIQQTVIGTYTVQAADAGEPIQCLVRGANGAGTGSAVVASLPAFVPDPQPAVDPPEPNDLDSLRRRAVLSDSASVISGSAKEAGEKLTCQAPWNPFSGSEPGEGWSDSDEGSAISWSFEFLRDGEPAPGTVTPGPEAATESEYELTAADVEAPAVFQCIAKATNEAPHSAVVESSTVITASPAPGFDPGGEAAQPDPNRHHVPLVEPSANSISGPLTVELELPGGQGTFAHSVDPNTIPCEKLPPSGAQPATVRCAPNEILSPGEELAALEVITALGSDAPDLATATATAFGGGAAPASDEFSFPILPAEPFGVESFTAALLDEAGEVHTQAGGHPTEAESELVLKQKRRLETPFAGNESVPVQALKETIVEVPPGVVGNTQALPALCGGVGDMLEGKCPPESAVGAITIDLSGVVSHDNPVYAIVPEAGAPAQFAFTELQRNAFVLTPRLRADDGYAVSLEVAPAPVLTIRESTVILCGYGADFSAGFLGCKEAGEEGANPKPLFTQPTRCGVELETRIRVNSWADDTFVEGPPFSNGTMDGCGKVPFEPTSDLRPTSSEADSPSGFEVELEMPTEGLEDPDGISQSHLRKAEVILPEGMAVNPSAARGLGACSEDEIKLGTNEPISCPGSSKVGTAEIETPILDGTLEGAVYIAEQGAVDGSLLGIYLVFESRENGILVKQAAKVTPDSETGQLVVTVEESPQQPFSSVKLSFPGGDRATLLTPPRCGTYEIENKLTPWSGGPPVTQTSEFRVTSGPGGGPCPTDALLPTLQSGVTSPLAGQPSPFVMRLHRPDGTDRFKAVGMHVPTGLIAKLKGIPYCPEATLAAISTEAGSGQGEIDSPSCPAASQIGRVIAGAGAGDDPFYVDTPRAYLAGPYKGAPVSIAVVAPAVAGPLDLGNVVVRNAVYINPKTAKIDVVSDPIPHILHGLLLDVRDVRVLVDRPNFTQNPTDCSPKRVVTDVRGLVETAIASPENPFQVGNCAALGFKPRIDLRLFGGVKRGDYQGLRAVVRPRPGDANIGRTVVRFPRSAFVAQENFRTICTRVQFKADACPKGAIYGKAIAYSPLLDFPLRGNVYLRSSDNTLPDLVADLRGPAHQPIRIELVGRTDSVKGVLRNTFDVVPDAPVSYFRLNLLGKRKGLIVNSRNICRGANKAAVAMSAQNGRRALLRPVLHNKRCAKQRRAKKRAAKRAARTRANRLARR